MRSAERSGSRSRRGRPLSLCIFHGRFARSECPPRKRGTRPRLCIASLRLALRQTLSTESKTCTCARAISPSHTRALERAILALPVAGEYYFQDGNCALPSRFSSKLQSSFNFFPLEITEKGTFDLTIDNWKYNSIIVRKDEPSLTILIQSSCNARENVSTHARSGSIELHLSQHFGETRSPPT